MQFIDILAIQILLELFNNKFSNLWERKDIIKSPILGVGVRNGSSYQ